MQQTNRCVHLLVLFLACSCVIGIHAESGDPDPQPVGDDAGVLLRKITADFIETPLGECLKMMSSLARVKCLASQDTGDKPVTLTLMNVTNAEALRQIHDQAACTYRIVNGQILIATEKEFAEIDAGKSTFEPWQEKKQTPVANTLKPIATIFTTTNTTYTHGGKRYTEEELKKEHPELWEMIQSQK